MVDFFETYVENLEPNIDKKKDNSNPSNITKKKNGGDKKRCMTPVKLQLKRHRKNKFKKYCKLYGVSSHTTDNCKDMKEFINKHKKKKQ